MDIFSHIKCEKDLDYLKETIDKRIYIRGFYYGELPETLLYLSHHSSWTIFNSSICYLMYLHVMYCRRYSLINNKFLLWLLTSPCPIHDKIAITQKLVCLCLFNTNILGIYYINDYETYNYMKELIRRNYIILPISNNLINDSVT